MARDDYYVIVYKLLAYLYSQLKKGQKIEPEMIKHDGTLFQINKQYWVYIMQNMIDQGYIRGISQTRAGGGYYIEQQLADCEITPRGIDYLCDNSLMEKAKRFLKDIKDITPFI